MRGLAFVAATVMLSGCATFDRLLSFDTDTQNMAAVPSGDLADPPAPKSPIDDSYHKGAGRVAPVPKRKPQIIAMIEPGALVGLSPVEVHEMIGQPVTVTDRAPAKIWNYRSSECSADITFYLDIGSSTFRALTLDLKDSAGKPTSEPRCLGSIQAMNQIVNSGS